MVTRSESANAKLAQELAPLVANLLVERLGQQLCAQLTEHSEVLTEKLVKEVKRQHRRHDGSHSPGHSPGSRQQPDGSAAMAKSRSERSRGERSHCDPEKDSRVPMRRIKSERGRSKPGESMVRLPSAAVKCPEEGHGSEAAAVRDGLERASSETSDCGPHGGQMGPEPTASTHAPQTCRSAVCPSLACSSWSPRSETGSEMQKQLSLLLKESSEGAAAAPTQAERDAAAEQDEATDIMAELVQATLQDQKTADFGGAEGSEKASYESALQIKQESTGVWQRALEQRDRRGFQRQVSPGERTNRSSNKSNLPNQVSFPEFLMLEAAHAVGPTLSGGSRRKAEVRRGSSASYSMPVSWAASAASVDSSFANVDNSSDDRSTVVSICVADRTGLLAKIMSKIFALGIDIVRGEIMTTEEGRAQDVFHVQREGAKLSVDEACNLHHVLNSMLNIDHKQEKAPMRMKHLHSNRSGKEGSVSSSGRRAPPAHANLRKVESIMDTRILSEDLAKRRHQHAFGMRRVRTGAEAPDTAHHLRYLRSQSHLSHHSVSASSSVPRTLTTTSSGPQSSAVGERPASTTAYRLSDEEAAEPHEASLYTERPVGRLSSSGLTSIVASDAGEERECLASPRTWARLLPLQKLREQREAQIMESEPFGQQMTEDSDEQENCGSPLLGTTFLSVCGIMPWDLAGSGRLSKLYRFLVFALVVLALGVLVVEIALDHMGTTVPESWHRLHDGGKYAVPADLALASGVILGLVFLGFGVTGEIFYMLFQFVAREGYLQTWQRAALGDLCLALVTWLLAVVERGRMMGIFATEDHGLHLWTLAVFLSFAFIAFLLSALAFYTNYVCIALGGVVDIFCNSVLYQDKIVTVIHEWNVLQAILRKTSSSIEYSLFAQQSMVLLGVTAGMVEALQGVWNWDTVAMYSLLLVTPMRAFFRAASVTDKCVRVPPLVNSLSFGIDMDIERQYVVDYIVKSGAGFYVFDTQITSALAMKFVYMYAAMVFAFTSKLM